MTSLNHKLVLDDDEVQEAVLVPLLSTFHSNDDDTNAKDFATHLNSLSSQSGDHHTITDSNSCSVPLLPIDNSPDSTENNISNDDALIHITPRSSSHHQHLQKSHQQISSASLIHQKNYRDLQEATVDTSVPSWVNNVETVVRDKFGWIEGVLIRNMLSIWGVMLFLRISWVVAQSGIWQTLIIIAVSTFITLVTALSISALSTNGEIGCGGTYYVISRIMGPEFGGSVGIIFALANAIFCSLNVVGIGQTIQDAMKNHGGYIIVDGDINDVRIIGGITMVVICCLCQLGAKYEAKTQGAMLVLFTVGFVNFIVGSILGPGESEEKKARGFLGYDLDLLWENWGPDYRATDGDIHHDFFSVFAIYFPAMIGILAGANISGNLKDPNSAIPKGTILAILITSASYVIVAVICGVTMKREATGNINDLRNGTYLDCVLHNCTYGIYHDYQAMTLISGFGPLNYAGCFAATFGSALASYVSCPKLIQMISDDEIFPHYLVGCLGKGYGKSKEPLRAYALTFILALAFVLIAYLDAIAILISDFFLITFAMLNYANFYVSWINPVGWRPTFKCHNKWLSLFTAIICVICTFLINWMLALVNLVIVVFFYFVVASNQKEVNWGSSTQGRAYDVALSGIYQLNNVEEHVKNYKPQILVLSGQPSSRGALVDLGHLICKSSSSLLVCGNIIQERLTANERAALLRQSYAELKALRVKGFCEVVDNEESFEKGLASMISLSGLGKMKPNIVLFGYKSDWQSCDEGLLDHYLNAIHTASDFQMGVALLRMPRGRNHIFPVRVPKKKKKNEGGNTTLQTETHSADQVLQPLVPTIFRSMNGKKGIIDVWWLYDDGGLTLLLPHIIIKRSHGWSSCKLRVFCCPALSNQENFVKELSEMKSILEKFRIDYSELVVIDELREMPTEWTQNWFNNLVKRRESCFLTAEKTNRHLRLKELLMENSVDSNLVVMSLPVCPNGTVSARLYMAWIETLTINMPPFILVRGSNTVLTCYA